MPFEFRLEKVLQYRKRVVEKHTRDVAEANRVVVAIQERTQALQVDIDQLLQTNGQGLNSTLEVGTLINRGQWLAHLEDTLAELQTELDSAQEELATRRDYLTHAWQDLEVLERLREKQKDQWLEERRKIENKELDEVGQIRADRRMRENLSS